MQLIRPLHGALRALLTLAIFDVFACSILLLASGLMLLAAKPN